MDRAPAFVDTAHDRAGLLGEFPSLRRIVEVAASALREDDAAPVAPPADPGTMLSAVGEPPASPGDQGFDGAG